MVDSAKLISMRKNYLFLFVFTLVITSCVKKSSQDPIAQRARDVGKAVETTAGGTTKKDPNAISQNVVYSDVVELQLIEPGVYHCYYAGVSLKFKNLIYDVTNECIPTLYADLFWTDKPNNVSIREGSNFSTFFVLDETYCPNAVGISYSLTTDTIAGVLVVDRNKVRLLHNGLPITQPISAFSVDNYSVTTVKRGISYTNGYVSFLNYSFTVNSSLCSGWEVKRIVGKLYTAVVSGVRKYYVAPMSYDDPILCLNPPE